MTAAAYLRRSRVDTRREGAISHEQQLAAIRSLAERHGDDPDALQLIEDWGKSGRAEKQHLRTGFAQLEAMVADGSVSVIYAYSANRLARSLEALSRLAKACEAASVPIRCADGYSPDVSTSTGRMVLGILGSVYAWQAEWTQERMIEATAVRRGRGDHMGPAPFGSKVVDGRLVENDSEDPSIVVEAFRRAGTYQGAARLLTEQGIPSRTGRQWATSAVRGILRREAPEEIPATISRGRPPVEPMVLRGLLRCPHDLSTLVGHRNRRRNGWVSYDCRKAGETPGHPLPRSIAESKVLPWVRAEAARLRVPEAVETTDDEQRRTALEAERDRWIDQYGEGLINKAKRDAKLATIADELADLSARLRVQAVPSGIDWTWPAATINGLLRATFAYVELDPALRPVRAEWNVREWRAA
jgi:DNA invertase Pin-like site-specific DNA recombinase